MSIKRGDIALVYFPYTDHKTIKKRPALVVQADNLKTELPNIIVAEITSEISRAGFPCRIKITKSDPKAKGSGLLTDSVIMTDNLATLHTSLIYRTIGKLSDMTDIDIALRNTLGI